MGEVVTQGPCPECASSDAFTVYTDGGGYCFSCKYLQHPPKGEEPANPEPVPRMAITPLLTFAEARPLPARKLDLKSCAKYGYLSGSFKDEPCHVATYYDAKGRACAQKLRFEDKRMLWLGEPKRAVLFGQQLWREGGRRVVVTEGEIDAVSAAQVQGLRWPVVSIPNGASGAARDLAKQLEWLESYEQIVLLFDNDEAGQAAAAECAELFTPGKVAIGKLPRKDANEMLVAGDVKALVSAIWEAKVYRPEGVISGLDLIERVLEKPAHGIEYPWDFLTDKLYGQRPGEIVCWTAGTGLGKSTMMRQLVAGLRESGHVVGVVSLEETLREAALGQVSVVMQKPLHLADVRETVSDDELRIAAQRALDGVHFYDPYALDAEVILPKIRYMVKALGVEWVVLDHISIMVSGTAAQGDERKRIDELMTKLRTQVQELGIGLHIVVHLRKTQGGGKTHEEGGRVTLQDIRGSGAIAQISNIIVAGERNQQDEDNGNVIVLRGLKNRHSGITGVYGALSYDLKTGLLSECELPEKDDGGRRKGFPDRAEHMANLESNPDEEIPF